MSLLALQQNVRDWLTTESADVAGRFGKSATPGLAVYINNYRGQLMACLTESYAMLRSWLGGEAFEAAAATHIDRVPPHSWTLDAYALDFPHTLDALYPDDPEIGDLARLERDLGLAFVGLDVPPLDLAQLGDIDWDGAVLDLVPSFSMRTTSSNAAAIWSAIHAGETPPAAALLPAPAMLAVWRHEFTPAFRTLDPMESMALSMASRGRTFGEICGAAVDEAGPDEGPFVAGNFLAQWLRDGLIGAIRSGPPAVTGQRRRP